MTYLLYGAGLLVGLAWWNYYEIPNWAIALIIVSVVGFTQNQRAWFLRRDGNRCQFHFRVAGVWVRCKNTDHLQIHHIVPRGWAAKHFPHKFPINGPMNGIALCKMHHVGYGVDPEDKYETQFVVHPDIEVARRRYVKGQDPNSYEEMQDVRRELNEGGLPYWNTMWDWMFNRIANLQTLRFARKEEYPENRRRGRTGREP